MLKFSSRSLRDSNPFGLTIFHLCFRRRSSFERKTVLVIFLIDILDY